jgi:signal transduction histidine kinase
VAVSLHGVTQGGRMLMLRDVTALADLQHNLAETQLALDAAMAALRAPPHGLRMFLGSALTSISAIRAILKMPARDPDALHDKLARLHAAVAQLGREAEALQLAPIHDACQALLMRLAALLERDELTGGALLPLAILVDRIAGAAGTLWRIEEQRYVEPAPAKPRVRRQADWTFASERRWASFLRHRGEEIGVLVTLEMTGAVHVPKHLRAGVDDLLQHILRNAVEHGIETPEERLAAQKPASGKVTVCFENLGGAQLRMTVRDDGRGRGLGLTFLRKAVAQLGGQIAVAARPEQYTQFVIDLPQGTDAAQKPAISQ